MDAPTAPPNPLEPLSPHLQATLNRLNGVAARIFAAHPELARLADEVAAAKATAQQEQEARAA